MGSRKQAFTLIELLIVMSIIIVLAGLILATSTYVQKKGYRSRAEAEIAAMSAAMESYKADNGIYPSDPTLTDGVDPAASPVPTPVSKFLYGQLSGDTDGDGTPESGKKTYMSFKPATLELENPSQPISGTNKITALRDPFGHPYGYSTAKAANATVGYNPTFDLWSTAGTTGNTASDREQWITNW